MMPAGGHLQGNCTHPMDDKAAVWLCHGHIPNHGPQEKTIPDHLWPVRLAASPSLDTNVEASLACAMSPPPCKAHHIPFPEE